MLVRHHGISKKDCYEVKREVPDKSTKYCTIFSLYVGTVDTAPIASSKIAANTSKQRDLSSNRTTRRILVILSERRWTRMLNKAQVEGQLPMLVYGTQSLIRHLGTSSGCEFLQLILIRTHSVFIM